MDNSIIKAAIVAIGEHAGVDTDKYVGRVVPHYDTFLLVYGSGYNTVYRVNLYTMKPTAGSPIKVVPPTNYVRVVRIPFLPQKPVVYMVIDTETTSKYACGSGYIANVTCTEKFSSPVQASYELIDGETHDVLWQYDSLIKPYQQVSPHAEAVHGISYERAMSDGIEPATMIADLMDALSLCDAVVGYNHAFDIKIIMCSAVKCHMGPQFAGALANKRMVDLMSLGLRVLVGARATNGALKNPKLTEAYQKVFCRDMGAAAHNSAHDVRATAELYRELLKKGTSLKDDVMPEKGYVATAADTAAGTPHPTDVQKV